MLDINDKVTHEQYLQLDGEQAALLMAKRFQVLQKLGCDPESSVVIAVHPEISITQALQLLEHGCDPRTLLRILL